MLEFFRELFGTDFMPHIYCLRGEQAVVWLHVLSDLGTAAAYYAIPLMLFEVVRKRPDPRFRKIAILFVLFIGACGTTHVLAVWILWHPMYRLEGVVKAATAALSVSTAVVLMSLRPMLYAIPTPSQLAVEVEGRRQAEVRDREREERFRNFVDSVHEYAINLLDPEGRILTWNEGARRIHGLTATEALGQPFSIFFTQDDIARGEPERLLAQTALHGHARSVGRRRGARGSLIWAEVDFTALRDASGQLTGFTRVLHDMTAQKTAEQELRSLNAQLERYRLIVENIDEYAIYTLDTEGIVTGWSAGAQKAIGYASNEVLGRRYSMFFPPEQVEAGAPGKELEEAAQTGRCLTDDWRVTRDGSRKWASGALSAVRGPDGALTGFVRVSRDMTHQKMMEDSLAQLNADLESRVAERTAQLEATVVELQKKNQEVEAFVYIVSHDLRAPLVNVQGFVSELDMSCSRLKTLLGCVALPEPDRQLVGEILEEDISGALRFISASSSKFERLIEALLGLSRQGRRIYRMEPIDARNLVDNAIAAMQQMIDEAKASIRIGPLPPVTADRTALDQVFSNLIANSVKYRSVDRPLVVEVGGTPENNTVHYWVRDNGLGIPESGKAKLFQVFQRLHPQMASGEGMGLAIVHRIVERHGGKIWAESEENAGTAFHFTIPVSQPAASAEVTR